VGDEEKKLWAMSQCEGKGASALDSP